MIVSNCRCQDKTNQIEFAESYRTLSVSSPSLCNLLQNYPPLRPAWPISFQIDISPSVCQYKVASRILNSGQQSPSIRVIYLHLKTSKYCDFIVSFLSNEPYTSFELLSATKSMVMFPNPIFDLSKVVRSGNISGTGLVWTNLKRRTNTNLEKHFQFLTR